MSESFNIKMVGREFREKVDNAISHGAKEYADKKEDFEELNKLLAGLDTQSDEYKYVKSKMNEYETQFKLCDLKNRARGLIQDFVQKVKDMYEPENKELDRDEAEILVNKLRELESRGEHPEDVEYIRAELEAAGFNVEQLLNQNKPVAESGPSAAAPEPAKKPAMTPAKPKSTQTPAKPKSTQTPASSAPKYDAQQQKLINDMNMYIDYILGDRNNTSMRNIDISQAKKILRDAEALELQDTKEYKRLYNLVYPNAQKSIEAGTSVAVGIAGIPTGKIKPKY